MKKVLILGATGAMATYLVPHLINSGYSVTGITLEDVLSDTEKLNYIKANAKDKSFLSEILSEGFDAIVDFLVYNTKEMFREYFDIFKESGAHYIFLSSYRVYSGEYPITEETPRIFDTPLPDGFVTDLEYSIYKAEEEDLLRSSGYPRYTIVRPAVTYSSRRFQLTTLEANVLIPRMLAGKTVTLPEGAMDCEATMTWAGDIAKMIGAIILNPEAYGETYTVSTSEHHTWREIAEMYKRVFGLKYVAIPDDDYLDIFGFGVYARQQLKYDRCFMRIIDNSKIMKLAGLRPGDLMPLEEGLKLELSSLNDKRISEIGCYRDMNDRMDAYLSDKGIR